MTNRALSGLAFRRFLARGAILFEALWPAILRALCLVALFLCAAFLNLPPMLPGWLHFALLAAVTLGITGLLIKGLWTVRPPDNRDADRRLETRSGLGHRPISVLTDRPAANDPIALALWEAHTTRAADRITRLRAGWPKSLMALRDPNALRNVVFLSFIATLVIANVDAPSRLEATLRPDVSLAVPTPATQLQAWLTPPAYTRMAPIFLKAGGGDVSAPAGSHLTVNISGGTGEPVLTLDGKRQPFIKLDRGSFQAEQDLTRGGLLTVMRDNATLAWWNLTVIADEPPAVAWGEHPGPAPASQQTRLPWTVSDDYGVVHLQAELRLQARPDAPPLIAPIPLPNGSVKSAHGAGQTDLTAHPWAGLPVIATLTARDQPGQSASSEETIFVIGERPFHNPVARLLIAARKSLSVHPDDRGDAQAVLDGLMQQPELFGGDIGAFLNLSAIYYDLARNQADSTVGEAQGMMWELALHMEEGRTEQTAQSLEQARQAARDAMDKAREQPGDATREDLAKKLEALRQAIDQHMRALIEEAKRNNAVMPFDPKAMQMSDRDMQRMAEQAEQAAKEGRMSDAQQQMAELEKMLDRLRNARVQQGDRQANSKRQRGKRQQSVVQDLIGREGGLLDHTQQRGGPKPGAADPGAQRDADVRVQQALRRALGELMQQFTDLTGEASPGLGEADQAMRDAGAQLNQGNDAGAGGSQQKAIAALQKGNKDMAQALSKMGQGQQDQGEGEDGDDDDSDGAVGMMSMPDGQRGEGRGSGPMPGSPDRADSGNRDPLGRYNQGNAADNADALVPEERERQRTQAIEEELRRRGADQQRPRQELDYIDRLLKQF